MGLDGLSVSNLGLHKEFTSAQLADNAEALAKKGSEFSIKNIEGLSDKQKIKRKESEEEEEKESNQEHSYYDDEEVEIEDDDDEDENKEESKQYSVKLNQSSQLIELIDLDKNSIIETISPSDLIKLVSKLNATSGILVNKEI